MQGSGSQCLEAGTSFVDLVNVVDVVADDLSSLVERNDTDKWNVECPTVAGPHKTTRGNSPVVGRPKVVETSTDVRREIPCVRLV